MIHEQLEYSVVDGFSVWRPNPSRVIKDFKAGAGWVASSRELEHATTWTPEQIIEAIRSSEGLRFLEELIYADGVQNRYLIGLLLSALPARLLSPNIRASLGIVETNSEAAILPFHEAKYLCGDSEAKLQKSMGRKSAVLVGDAIVLKDEGRKAGLCIQTTSTSSGTFLAGSWYQMTDDAGAERIFQDREKRIELQGEWFHLRDVTAFHPHMRIRDVVSGARIYARGIR